MLMPIQEEIAQEVRHIDELPEPPSGEDDFSYQSIIDDGCEAIEDLLGVAFVIVQTHITQVVSRTLAILRNAERMGKSFGEIRPSRDAITRTCSTLVADTQVAEVQVIDALANYFKHHDEWRGDWVNLTGKSRKTADIIVAVGASQGSTGNLRTGAKALGIEEFNRLERLVGIIGQWRQDLETLMEREAKLAGYL